MYVVGTKIVKSYETNNTLRDIVQHEYKMPSTFQAKGKKGRPEEQPFSYIICGLRDYFFVALGLTSKSSTLNSRASLGPISSPAPRSP